MTGTQRSKLLTIITGLGILLAGCDGIADKSADVIKQGVNEAVAMGNTVSDKALDWKKDGIRKDLSAAQAAGSALKLHLENKVGNIEMKAASGDQINVNATIWSQNDSSRKAEYEEIMDNAEISIIKNGEQLDVVTHPKGDEKHDLWEWAKDKYGKSNFSIEYVVEIPASMNSFEIISDVGEIHLSDLKGTYHISNHVGRIHIERAHITGKSSVESEAGSLRLSINEMDSKSSLKAVTKVGSINAALADSLECSLQIDSEVGRITGAAKGKSDINGGGPLLSLTSSVGSIAIEKP